MHLIIHFWSSLMMFECSALCLYYIFGVLRRWFAHAGRGTIVQEVYMVLGENRESSSPKFVSANVQSHVNFSWNHYAQSLVHFSLYSSLLQLIVRICSGDEEYLYVHGVGIRSGDSFRFYHASSDLARASCNTVANNFRHLKQLLNYECDDHTNSNGVATHKKPVFGGIMFACCGRGKLFFGEPNVDGSPFLEKFPGVTFSGTYCTGEIARADLCSYEQGSQEHSSISCNLHVFSTVYLVMSYTPPLPQH